MLSVLAICLMIDSSVSQSRSEGACLERDGDYIHFELNEDGDMNWFGRYGSNWDADESIIKHMANTLNIPIYSEYEEEFDELWEKEREGV